MHRLLRKQIDRYLKEENLSGPNISKFLEAVSEAYEQSDEDSKTLETAMDLASDELTERYNALRKEIDAKEKAQEADRAKTEFLSRMSHELRTPMNAILGFGQLLARDSKNPLTQQQNKNIREILKAGSHLLELINDVLDLSTIESGKLSLSIENVNLFEVVKESLELVVPAAEQRNIRVINEIHSHNNSYVKVDRTRFKQVLLNILTNSIKYNNENGQVILKVNDSEPDKILLEIKDTGIGIPKDQHEFIFEPFNRMGAEESSVEGIGIGLSIAHRLLTHMKGEIQFESEVGKGTTFSLQIVKGEAPELPCPDSVKQHSEKDCLSEEQSKLVLYIEDNPANLKLVEEIFKVLDGVSLLTAPQAKMGIELAKSHLPDLILMDINLPEMDGHTALKLLRSFEETKDIPTIAISANAMKGDIEKGLQSGFLSYITKPIQVDTFINTLNKYLDESTYSKPVS